MASDSDAGDVTTHGVTIDSGDVANNARVELRDSVGGGRTPYIDFSNDAKIDYDARLILESDDALSIQRANLHIGPLGSNTDSLFFQRIESGSDNTHLRINIGDDGQSSDCLDIGYYFFNGGAWVSRHLICMNGSTSATSDERFRTNIESIANPLEKVLALRGVSFNWKEDASTDTGTHIGFIAQEVESVLPELVNTDSQGYKGVAYNTMVSVLVEAMKEQQTQIAALETRLAELENR